MVSDELATYVGTSKKVRVERCFPSERLLNGFVHGVGPALALMEVFHDFYNEGYVVFRLDDIESIRSGEFERFWERMFLSERLIHSIGIEEVPPLDDLHALLASLAMRERNIIIECECSESDECDFFIGRIELVDDESILFHYFDALGKWADDLDEIQIEDITKVSFDTPYVNTFSKYLEA